MNWLLVLQNQLIIATWILTINRGFISNISVADCCQGRNDRADASWQTAWYKAGSTLGCRVLVTCDLARQHYKNRWAGGCWMNGEDAVKAVVR